MIRVLADSVDDATLIAEAVGGPRDVVNGSSWLPGGDAQLECVILGWRSPVPPERLELIRELGREMPWVPVILVTDQAPDVARWLREQRVSDIVWFEAVRTELRGRVETQCRTAALFTLAAQIEASTLPHALRRGLAHSFRAATDRPVRTVKELAQVLGRSPVTLSQAFRTRVSSEATLGQFLNALVILRAHQLRNSRLTWEAVGRRLGYSRSTLHLKSKQWTGQTLKQLARTPRAHLMSKFVSEYVDPLFKGGMQP